MTYPNFLVIGAQRSGTTTLYHYLERHPQVYLYPGGKELNFFLSMTRRKLPFEDYQQFFTGWNHQPFVGDVSPNYLYHYKTVAPLIRANLPDVKLITVLRNPTDRSYSAYCYTLSTGREWLPFEAAFERRRMGKATLDYKYVSGYSEQLKGYLDLFPREQMLFLLFEDMVRDPMTSLHRICDFLGADAEFKPSIIRHEDGKTNSAHYPYFPGLTRNLVYLKRVTRRKPVAEYLGKLSDPVLERLPVRAVYPPLSHQTRQKLDAYFAPEIDSVAALTGIDLSGWRN